MSTELVMRLGRHVEHDERSWGFMAALAPDPASVKHPHYGAVLDQGKLGSCTGNAYAQALNTGPLHVKGTRLLKEADAVTRYTRATQLDNVPGQMPEQDTGSTGLAVAKAGVEAGEITAYHHAFGLDQMVAALTLSPVIVGTVWTQDMFTPDAHGFIRPGGNEVGGHEYEVLAQNLELKYFAMLNSWSKGWGKRGRAYISFDDMDQLLRAQGDVTVLVR